MASGELSVFVDGVDEVPRALMEKALRLVRLLRRLTAASPVWVATRTQEEAYVQAVLGCSTASLEPLSEEDQRRYVRSLWTPEVQRRQPRLSADAYADAVLGLMAQTAGGLLEAPMHLRMMADVIGHAIAPAIAPAGGQSAVSIADIFDRFAQRKGAEALRRQSGGDPVWEGSQFQHFFLLLHRTCAMYLLTRDMEITCEEAQDFKRDVLKYKDTLQTEKAGLMWAEFVGEDPNILFVHQSFAEFFCAQWLVENLRQRLAQGVVRRALASDLHGLLSDFLFWLLSRGRPLLWAVRRGKFNELQEAVRAGRDVDAADAAGRTALHIAALHVNVIFTKELLQSRCRVDARDLLFGYTPLQYLELYFANSRKEDNVYHVAIEQMELLLKAKAEPCKLSFVADNLQKFLRLAVGDPQYPEVMKLLLKKHDISEHDYVYALHAAEKKKYTDTVHSLLTNPPSRELRKEHSLDCEESTSYSCSGHLKKTIHQFEQHRNDHSEGNCNTPLQCLVHEGNPEEVKKFLTSSSPMECDEQPDSMSPLSVAVYKGDLECAKLLMDHGYSVNSPDSDGFTPVHVAVEMGNTKMLKLFLDNGGNAMMHTDSGLSPVHLAAIFGRVDCLELLREYTSATNVLDSYGFTPLHIAAAMSDAAVMEKLLQIGHHPNPQTQQGCTPLYFTALSDNEECAKCLLQHKEKLNMNEEDFKKLTQTAQSFGSHKVAELLSQSGDDSELEEASAFSGQVKRRAIRSSTPLHTAVERGDNETVQSLLLAGADANAKADDGKTPLAVAAFKGRQECVDLLLFEADPNIPDDDGFTPLHLAAQRGYANIVQTLLDAEANPNALAHNGNTPLIQAVFFGNKACIDVLFPRTDITRADTRGLTHLHWAAHLDSPYLMRKLLIASVDVNATMTDGRTPLLIAVKNGRKRCVQLLLENEADVNLADDSSFTPLHHAVRGRVLDEADQDTQLEIVRMLLKKGASVNAEAADGCTPLSLATNDAELVAVLNGSEAVPEENLSVG